MLVKANPRWGQNWTLKGTEKIGHRGNFRLCIALPLSLSLPISLSFSLTHSPLPVFLSFFSLSLNLQFLLLPFWNPTYFFVKSANSSYFWGLRAIFFTQAKKNLPFDDGTTKSIHAKEGRLLSYKMLYHQKSICGLPWSMIRRSFFFFLLIHSIFHQRALVLCTAFLFESQE